MNPIKTFVKEVDLFVNRMDNVSNDELSQKQFAASLLRVSTYMATAGFALLAAVSLLSASAAGVLAFALLGIITYDVYQFTKNIDEMELQPTSKSVSHVGKMLWSGCKGVWNKRDPDHEINRSRIGNLTENTIFLRPITALTFAIFRA